MKGKNTVLDDMMCIELMEIVARKIELMVPLSLLNLPPAVGGKERGEGGGRWKWLIKLYSKWDEGSNK